MLNILDSFKNYGTHEHFLELTIFKIHEFKTCQQKMYKYLFLLYLSEIRFCLFYATIDTVMWIVKMCFEVEISACTNLSLLIYSFVTFRPESPSSKPKVEDVVSDATVKALQEVIQFSHIKSVFLWHRYKCTCNFTPKDLWIIWGSNFLTLAK